MFAPGDVISYLEMCQEEAASLQRGMNFRLGRDHSVVLMSLRRGAPYADRIEENGRVLIYEGHDISRTLRGRNPKKTDQPKCLPPANSPKTACSSTLRSERKGAKLPPSWSESMKKSGMAFGCLMEFLHFLMRG
jgi:hypothetical protein